MVLKLKVVVVGAKVSNDIFEMKVEVAAVEVCDDEFETSGLSEPDDSL